MPDPMNQDSPAAQPAEQSPPIEPAARPNNTAFDEATLRLFLSHIVDPKAGATELRLLGAQYQSREKIVSNPNFSSIMSGWYDNIDAMVADARKLHYVSAYICLNPTSPDLLGRSYNKLERTRHATTDDDIACLRWFYIDVDPKRPADISATLDELRRAVERRDTILRENPEVARASLYGRSGNGAFIMVRLPDYPNDAEHRALIKDATASFIAKYSDDLVEIDGKTKNPSRIGCVPGTLKCKGSHIQSRPWRRAYLDGVPEAGRTVEVGS